MFHKSTYIANVGRRCFLWGPVHLIPISTHRNAQHIVQSTGTNQLVSKGVVEGIVGKKQLTFDNCKEVFSKKKFSELLRAVFIFRLCSIEWLLTHSGKILVQGERLLGQNLWSQLLKPTLYGHFVAGETHTQIKRTINALRSAGIGPLLGVPMEEDADDHQRDKSKWYETNIGTILETIELAYELDPKYPMVHAKGTSLMPSKLIANISKLIPEPTERPEIVRHVADCIKNGSKFYDPSSLVGMNYIETHYNKTLNSAVLNSADKYWNKLTALLKVQIDGLDTGELEELQKGLEKLCKIGESAFEKGVIFMFDAEHTYVNAGLNLFTLAMMLNYNIQVPLIFFTYQSYQKGSSVNLDKDVAFIDAHGVKFGAKIVRGAYMDQERRRAASHGYPDPINDTYEDTSWRYQFNVEGMLKRIQKKPNNYRIIIATHNEESIKKSVAKLDELGIDRLGGEVFFGQVYGMGDHITYALVEKCPKSNIQECSRKCQGQATGAVHICCSKRHGFQWTVKSVLGKAELLVYKALPYGPIMETLSYLVRRMHENKSMLKGARRERLLIQQALKDRIWSFYK